MLQFIRRLLARFPRRPVVVRVEIIRRDPSQVSPRDWRSDPDHVQAAKVALNDPVVRQMIDVLRNGDFFRANPSSVEAIEQRVAYADERTGYVACLNDLESLGRPLKTDADPPMDFAAKNMEQD